MRRLTLRRVVAVLAVLAVAAGVALATQERWKPAARRHKWYVISASLYQNTLRLVGIRHDQIDQAPPTEKADDYRDALTRADAIFADYLSHSGLSVQDLAGKDVLELGPGYNLAVALRFVAEGANSVTAIDKFVPFQDTDYTRGLYAAMRERLAPPARARLDQAIVLDNHITLRTPKLRYVYGQGVEDRPFAANSFDLVVSHAVLEEIYDPDVAFDAMDAVLRPGGYSLHKIDLRDYGMFTRNGFHPLEFLTVPDAVYRRMAENTGQPNRRRVDYYREKMASLGYDATIFTTHVLGSSDELKPHKIALEPGVDFTPAAVASLDTIRPRLLERYRRLSDTDLMIQGIYLVARKPAAPTRTVASAR